jgi:hypothetical protein
MLFSFSFDIPIISEITKAKDQKVASTAGSEKFIKVEVALRLNNNCPTTIRSFYKPSFVPILFAI